MKNFQKLTVKRFHARPNIWLMRNSLCFNSWTDSSVIEYPGSNRNDHDKPPVTAYKADVNLKRAHRCSRQRGDQRAAHQ
jgi:hypothetical protein